jgi:hypothetical protein
MLYGIGKRTREPLQISINRGSHPRGKKKEFLEIQILFKTSFSSKEILSKVHKPPSSTFEVYKEQRFVGSSINTP